MIAYLNGRWLSERRAHVPVLDHGYLYGDGVFETMRAYDGAIFMLPMHLSRLRHALGVTRIRLRLSDSRLTTVLNQSLRKNRLRNAYVRLTVTRGPGEIGLDPTLCPAPTVLVLVRPFTGYPPRRYARGVSAVVAAVRTGDARAVAPVLKTTSFIGHILARIEAKARRADEALLMNAAGFLTEGSVSNLFIVKRNRLLTPPVAQGLLPGVTRAVVLRLGRAAGLAVEERRVAPTALREADEAFLTNTMLEVMPLVRVDGQAIGSGRPGAVTLELRRRYSALTAATRPAR